MLYRIRLDLAFTHINEVDDIYDKALNYLHRAVTINPDQDEEEIGFLQTEECYHDEHPPKPCKLLDRHTTS